MLIIPRGLDAAQAHMNPLRAYKLHTQLCTCGSRSESSGAVACRCVWRVMTSWRVCER